VIPESLPKDADALIARAFAAKRDFAEFVRASEGVPRDFINILSMACQRSGGNPVTYPDILRATKDWSLRDKEKTLSTNQNASKLFHYIGSQLTKQKRNRLFLVKQEDNTDLVESLYDYRVIHIKQQGYCNPSTPENRYNVYLIDYGSYLNFLGIRLDDEELLKEYEVVPHDSYKNIMGLVVDSALVSIALR
jgi:hypothetical protein